MRMEGWAAGLAIAGFVLGGCERRDRGRGGSGSLSDLSVEAQAPTQVIRFSPDDESGVAARNPAKEARGGVAIAATDAVPRDAKGDASVPRERSRSRHERAPLPKRDEPRPAEKPVLATTVVAAIPPRSAAEPPPAPPAPPPSAAPAAAPPAPAAAPKVIPLTALESTMTAGDKEIRLPAAVLQDLNSKAVKQAIILVKLCIDAAGAVDRAEVTKSSGYADADRSVAAKVREWRFRPYRVNGQPVPVCTVKMFRYLIE